MRKGLKKTTRKDEMKEGRKMKKNSHPPLPHFSFFIFQSKKGGKKGNPRKKTTLEINIRNKKYSNDNKTIALSHTHTLTHSLCVCMGRSNIIKVDGYPSSKLHRHTYIHIYHLLTPLPILLLLLMLLLMVLFPCHAICCITK